MITNKLLLLSVSVIAILVSSTVFVAIPTIPRASAQQKVPGANWEYTNANALGQNNNPQKQIGKENVNLLETKWVYPFPAGTTYIAKIKGLAVAEGVTTPPIVVDGIVYAGMNVGAILAIDATTGRTVWTYEPTYDLDAAKARGLPVGSPGAHMHSINYVDGNIIVNTFGCTFLGINALTGKESFRMEDLCLNVPTNSGIYAGGGFGSHPPTLYKKEKIWIWAIGGDSEGTFGARAFVMGIDANTKKVLWRTFLQPPEGAKFPAERAAWGQFLVDNCKKIWIQQISSCDIPQDILKNDWGSMPANAGISNVWGHLAVDEDTGIVYMGLAQPGPDWNATGIDGKVIPGPRLFGSSEIALNAKTGEFVWAHQTTTRDLWDWDCSWNTILAEATVKGQKQKVVFKACKNGKIHAFNPLTGEAFWALDPPQIKRAQYSKFLDPKSREDMVKPWQNYPSTQAYFQNCPSNGCIESDIAFDPERNTVFVGVSNLLLYAKPTPIYLRGDGGRQELPYPTGDRPQNTTILAIDANDGKIKWEFFRPTSAFRGGVIVSNGVVYFNIPGEGTFYALDADTGKPLASKYYGISTNVQPTIGATADGKMRVFQIIGGTAVLAGRFGLGGPVPGALVAIGLPDKLQEPQVITKEAIKGAPKEVLKEALKELPKDVLSQVAPTQETISPISYAVVGIGVIMIVVAGVVLSRRKKV